MGGGVTAFRPWLETASKTRKTPRASGRGGYALVVNRDSALSVVLNPGRPQTGKAMLVDGSLPVEEFIDAERVAFTSLFEAQETTTHGSNDFRLAANYPTSGVGWRQIRNSERAAVRTDNVLYARTHLYGHFTLYST
ncbi:hypothetical protein ASD83_12925 [Devosia sp. Root685]|nr:hypothetical protein ASD83_12925 [Devosia sp. Root685]